MIQHVYHVSFQQEVQSLALAFYVWHVILSIKQFDCTVVIDVWHALAAGLLMTA